MDFNDDDIKAWWNPNESYDEGPPNKMLKLMTNESLEYDIKSLDMSSIDKIDEIAYNQDYFADINKLPKPEMDGTNTKNEPVSARTRSKSVSFLTKG